MTKYARQADIYQRSDFHIEAGTSSASLSNACIDAESIWISSYNAKDNDAKSTRFIYKEYNGTAVLVRIFKKNLQNYLRIAPIARAILLPDPGDTPIQLYGLLVSDEADWVEGRSLSLEEPPERDLGEAVARLPANFHSLSPLDWDPVWGDVCTSFINEMTRNPQARQVYVTGGRDHHRLLVGTLLLALLRTAVGRDASRGRPKLSLGLSTVGPPHGDPATDYTIFCRRVLPKSAYRKLTIDLDEPVQARATTLRSPAPAQRPSRAPSPTETKPIQSHRPRPTETPVDNRLLRSRPDQANATPTRQWSENRTRPSLGNSADPTSASATPHTVADGETPAAMPAPAPSGEIPPIVLSPSSIRELLALAERIWTDKTSPAQLLQAIQDRLGPSEETEIRRVFTAAKEDISFSDEARALVLGGIHAIFSEAISTESAMLGEIEILLRTWPTTARILYAIRLLRARPSSVALQPKLLASIGSLIELASSPGDTEDAPLGMRLGFLEMAAGSDRLPKDVRKAATIAADELCLRSSGDIPPSLVLRVLARAAQEARSNTPLASAQATVATAGIAGALTDPILVHVASLALFQETGIAPDHAYGILRNAAEQDPRWGAGLALEVAFRRAVEERSDGWVCNDLLATTGQPPVDER